KEESALVSTEALTRIMDVLTDCESRLRDAASKKIFVEVAMLKAIQAREAVQIDVVLKQLHQLRAESRGTTSGPTAATTARAAVPERASKTPEAAATFREAADPTIPEVGRA